MLFRSITNQLQEEKLQKHKHMKAKQYATKQPMDHRRNQRGNSNQNYNKKPSHPVNIFGYYPKTNKNKITSVGNSLVVQWLGVHPSTAWGTGYIPGQESKSLHATWHGQKIK